VRGDAITAAISSTSHTPVETDPLKQDFRLFLFLCWKHLSLPDPTEVQYDIAHYLQHGPKRCVIEAFRGVGKSWITSAFVVWLLYCNPQLNILVVSASKQRADDFSTFAQRLIGEIEILAHLQPGPDQRSSKIAFDVGPARASHAPSVKSAGITGQITGSRADVIIADDIEVANNSATQAMRDKLAESVKEFDAILKPLATARIIYLGTPQTEQTVYGELPNRGYEIRIWPARYPTKKQFPKYGDRLAPKLARRLVQNPGLAGRPTDPARFTDAELVERELSYGRSGFALQFMLDTSLSDQDRYPLKLSDLIVMDLDPAKAPVDLAWGSAADLALNDLPNVGFSGDRLHRPFFVAPEWSAYHGVIMAVDPSGRGGDETGYAVVASLFGRLFLLDAGGLPGGYSMETLEALARIARAFKVNTVIVEPNFGDGMFNQLLAPVLHRFHPCSLEETERSSAQKERRIIDCLEPVMNQHRLVVDKGLFERDFRSTEGRPVDEQARYRLFYQMTRITKDRGSILKDDRIDAVALAVHWWTERLARDTAKAAEDHRAMLLQQELDRFMRNAIGRPLQQPSMIGRR